MNKIIVAINESDHGSTGNIAHSILEHAQLNGFSTYHVCYHSTNHFSNEYPIKISRFGYLVNNILVNVDGSDGFHNIKSTKRLITWLESVMPNVVHLHNLHGHYINIPLLFEFLRNNNIKVVWTIHDFWPITGRCAFFEFTNCMKWMCNKCYKCKHSREYPRAILFNKSHQLWIKKRELYKTIDKNLYVVCVSNWVKDNVKKSKCFSNVEIINNGIDLQNSCSTDYYNELKKIINDRKPARVFFSAAYPFDERKGFSCLLEMASRMPDCLFFVAGITMKEKKNLPYNIYPLGVIHNKSFMNSAYKIADCFFNPSLDETFGLVNVESLSNGTPVVAFNIGPFCDLITNQTGVLVEKNDFESLENALKTIEKNESISNKCILNAKRFSKLSMCEKYIDLYKRIV